jgi:hypothetical protein
MSSKKGFPPPTRRTPSPAAVRPATVSTAAPRPATATPLPPLIQIKPGNLQKGRAALRPPRPLPKNFPTPPPKTRIQRINEAGTKAGQKTPGNTRTNAQRQANIIKARNKEKQLLNTPPSPTGLPGAPVAGMGAPAGLAGAPVAGMGTPVAGMGAPVAGMGAPVAGMGAPVAGMGAPVAGMGAPAGAMGAPAGAMGAPDAGMPAPAAGMAAAPGIEPLLGRIAVALEQIVQRGGKRLFTLRKRKTRRRKTRGRR